MESRAQFISITPRILKDNWRHVTPNQRGGSAPYLNKSAPGECEQWISRIKTENWLQLRIGLDRKAPYVILKVALKSVATNSNTQLSQPTAFTTLFNNDVSAPKIIPVKQS
jgi:hypothetical protein